MRVVFVQIFMWYGMQSFLIRYCKSLFHDWDFLNQLLRQHLVENYFLLSFIFTVNKKVRNFVYVEMLTPSMNICKPVSGEY